MKSKMIVVGLVISSIIAIVLLKPMWLQQQYHLLIMKYAKKEEATSIYKTVDSNGVAHFSSNANAGQKVTVDTNKINRLHIPADAKDDTSNDPLTTLKEENERFAKQVSDIKAARIDQAVNQ